MPGFLVKGMLQIGKSSDDALVAKVHQRFKPDDPISRAHIRLQDEHYSGYAFRQPGGRCILLVTQPGSHHIRFAILTESSFNKSREADGMKIVLMTGMVMGVDSCQKLCLPPLYVERVSDATGFCRDEAIRKIEGQP